MSPQRLAETSGDESGNRMLSARRPSMLTIRRHFRANCRTTVATTRGARASLSRKGPPCDSPFLSLENQLTLDRSFHWLIFFLREEEEKENSEREREKRKRRRRRGKEIYRNGRDSLDSVERGYVFLKTKKNVFEEIAFFAIRFDGFTMTGFW